MGGGVNGSQAQVAFQVAEGFFDEDQLHAATPQQLGIVGAQVASAIWKSKRPIRRRNGGTQGGPGSGAWAVAFVVSPEVEPLAGGVWGGSRRPAVWLSGEVKEPKRSGAE